MRGLCVIGTSWRLGGMAQVADLTIPDEDRGDRLAALAREVGAVEILYLATCNRVEVIAVLPELEDSDLDEEDSSLLRESAFAALAGREPRSVDADCLRVWTGTEAVEHLFAVAAGLDSAQLGEREIRGQLRRSVRFGLEHGHCDDRLPELVNAALLAARRIHRRTQMDAANGSLARVALDLVEMEGGADLPIALVGVSPMTRKCARRMAAAGRRGVVINRTPERAHDLIAELGDAGELFEVRSLEEFRADPLPVAGVITATATAEPILRGDDLARLASVCGRLRILDMGVPANVCPEGTREHGHERIGMDEINRAAQERSGHPPGTLEAARAALGDELAEYHRNAAHRRLGRVMAGLGDQTRETLHAGILEIFSCRYLEQTDADCGFVDEWVERMAKRMSHVPRVGLRALAASHGPDAVSSFLGAAVPSLADEYRELEQRR